MSRALDCMMLYSNRLLIRRTGPGFSVISVLSSSGQVSVLCKTFDSNRRPSALSGPDVKVVSVTPFEEKSTIYECSLSLFKEAYVKYVKTKTTFSALRAD